MHKNNRKLVLQYMFTIRMPLLFNWYAPIRNQPELTIYTGFLHFQRKAFCDAVPLMLLRERVILKKEKYKMPQIKDV